MESKSILVNQSRQHDAYTDNGALTHSTSLNNVLDMFFLAGASRNISEQEIINLFTKAYIENPDLALKCLFWARDCRGGAGEKRFFQIIMKYMSTDSSFNKVFFKVFGYTPDFGYWKDIFVSLKPSKELLDWMTIGLFKENDGLLAKWFPRKGEWFKAMHIHCQMTPKELRKALVANSKTVEQKMCAKEWEDINFSHVPSKAFQIYKKAFERHDPSRFSQWLEEVQEGKAKVNSGQLFPYELYQSWQKGDRTDVIEEQWKSLPNYVTEGSFLPVCDVSGSMSGLPMDISISLGVYLSERNKSIFKDAFITFSGNPKMEYLQGSVIQRFRQLQQAHWDMNTDLNKALMLVLNTAVKAKLNQQDLPKTLLIISDMEFDEACPYKTNYEYIKEQYASYGYEIPKIAFWNVNGRIGNVPVNANQKNVALISGASPSIVKSVLEGKDFTPVGIMMHTLSSERYADIHC